MALQAGKTVIITGGNTGLGYQCAKAIARSADRWHIIIACRNREKGLEAVERLVRETGFSSIETMKLDLASTESIRLFAQNLASQNKPPLHAIVCNAGIQVVSGTTYTQDGFETTFGVNHLGHFLLVNLLLPHLVSPARIIFVSSDTHDPAKRTGMPAPRYRNPQALAWPQRYLDPAEQTESPNLIGRRHYTTSKLCNLLCTYEFARRLQNEQNNSITVNAFNPGGMPDTGLIRDWSPALRFLLRYVVTPLTPLFRVLGADVNTAATSGKQLARLVLDPQLAHVSGKYFSGLQAISSSQESYNSHYATELWDTSLELVKLPSSSH